VGERKKMTTLRGFCGLYRRLYVYHESRQGFLSVARVGGDWPETSSMQFVKRTWVALFVACFAVGLGVRPAEAAVVLGGTSDAEEIYSIEFNEVGWVNPSVTFLDIPDVGDLTVSFGTRFAGQSPGDMHNSLDDTIPNPPLRLAPSGMVKTMLDLSSPSGVMLGGVQGQALFTTPLAILFSSAVNYVAFDLGHLDENTSTLIEAFDAQGNSLGVFGGLPAGHNTYSLLEDEGDNLIAGVSIYVPTDGMDWEGFGLNNIQLAFDGDTNGGGMIPEPGTLVIWSLLGGLAMSSVWLKRRRQLA
jgi:hypothetical protein